MRNSQNLPSPSCLEIEPSSPSICESSDDFIDSEPFEEKQYEHQRDLTSSVNKPGVVLEIVDICGEEDFPAVDSKPLTKTRTELGSPGEPSKVVKRGGKENFRTTNGKPPAITLSELAGKPLTLTRTEQSHKAGRVSKIVRQNGNENSRAIEVKPQEMKRTYLVDKPEAISKTELSDKPQDDSFLKSTKRKTRLVMESAQPSSSAKRSTEKARNENADTPEKNPSAGIVMIPLRAPKSRVFEEKEMVRPTASVFGFWKEVGMESSGKLGNKSSTKNVRKESLRTPKRKCIIDEKEFESIGSSKKTGKAKSETSTTPKAKIVDRNESDEVEIPRASTSRYNLRASSSTRTANEPSYPRSQRSLSSLRTETAPPIDTSSGLSTKSKRGRKRKVDSIEKVVMESVNSSSLADDDFDMSDGKKMLFTYFNY